MSFTPIIAGSGLGAWAYLERTQEQQKEIFSRAPVVDRSVQDFKDRIQDIQSADQLVEDYSLLKVALGAFGLDEDINNKAFIIKVLESDLSDPQSLANKLADDRYSSMARTFGFNSSDGPQLSSSGALVDYPGVDTPDDLLSNRSQLRQALDQFGLGEHQNNQFFLQRVLESDLSDPTSFANKLSDPKLAEFAAYFDFTGREPEHANPIEALVAEFDKYEGELDSAEDLVEDEDLLQAVIDTFGLQRTSKTFIKDILLSDPTDDSSLVNTLEDKRYLAVSEAFGFGWPDVNQMTDPDEFLNNSRLREEALDRFDVSDRGDDFLRDVLSSDLADPDSFVNQEENLAFFDLADAFQNEWPAPDSKIQIFSDAVSGKLQSMTAATDVVFDLDVFEATVELFGMGDRSGDFVVMQKTLESDPESGTSFANFHPDKRMEAMARAFSFDAGSDKRVYPEGFADEIADRYVSRQFEVSVGEVDPSMRLALSLERELTSIVGAGGGEDAHWFNIMGSPPMRELFETAMQMPSGFGSLDIDQQLGLMKEKSQIVFGTEDPADFLDPDQMDAVRKRYLLMSGLGDYNTSGTSSSILSLLG